MPKIKTINMRVKDLEFKYDVYVNVDGLFTATIPIDIAEELIKCKIDLSYNKLKNPGYFFDRTLDGLNLKIKEKVDLYFSKELIEEKVIIKYIIQTRCSYVLGQDKEIFPNGYYLKNSPKKGCIWSDGTIDVNATYPSPFGFLIYVKPFVKKTYRYLNEKIQTEYLRIQDVDIEQLEKKPYLKWLSDILTICEPDGHEKVKEIDYDEKTARFFVDLIKSVCQLNEKIKDFLNPEKLSVLISSSNKLLN
jgi:hypothetical protein